MSLSEESLQGHYTQVAESRKRGLKQWQKCDGNSQWKLRVKRCVFKERLKTASDGLWQADCSMRVDQRRRRRGHPILRHVCMCVCVVCEGRSAHSWWSRYFEASRTEDTRQRTWRTSSLVREDMETCLANSGVLGTGVAPTEGLFHHLCKLLLLLYCFVILLLFYLTIVLVLSEVVQVSLPRREPPEG